MATARWFDESKVTPGMVLPYGVPMRDLSDAEIEAYPEHVQASIDTWPVFAKRNPNPTPRAPKDDEREV